VQYLCCLLEGLLVDSDENDGVRSKTVLCGSLDILDNVLAFGKVDE